MNPRSVVLLYSGGADSTLCAMLLRERGAAVHALSVLYEGRPAGELAAARALANELSFASVHEMRLDGLAKGAPAWVDASHPHHEGLVPYRNLLFWSLAANRAAAVGADALAAGHTSYDAECYDDAAPAFFETLSRSLRFSGLGADGRPLEIVLPLAGLTPPQMASMLLERRDFLRRTWSCWRDGAAPCGACFACRERTFEALAKR
jgi:7-cyano-7-deazaguanine synthase